MCGGKSAVLCCTLLGKHPCFQQASGKNWLCNWNHNGNGSGKMDTKDLICTQSIRLFNSHTNIRLIMNYPLGSIHFFLILIIVPKQLSGKLLHSGPSLVIKTFTDSTVRLYVIYVDMNCCPWKQKFSF